MRQVGVFETGELAAKFVGYLKQKHITALIEEDQGSFAVWVHDEGQVRRARKMYEGLAKEDFKTLSSFEVPQKSFEEPSEGGEKKAVKKIVFIPIITNLLLFVCTFVYVFGFIQFRGHTTKVDGIVFIPKIQQALLIDYPRHLVLLDELVNRYGAKDVNDNTLPPEAEPMVKELNSSVPWVGIYNILLAKKDDRGKLLRATLFGDVRKGEVWRLFTPAILHRDFLHFLFNMLWLIVLGKMVEFSMGRIRFLLFVLFAGVLTNISQYFISGFLFMGISGVITAFIGYIWVRKKQAPWEVYPLNRGAMIFLLVYIFGLFGLQGVFFALQYFNIYTIPFYIANTAHVVGFLVGALLGKTNLLAKSI